MKRFSLLTLCLFGCMGKTISMPIFDPKITCLCDASFEGKAGYKLMCKEPMQKAQAHALFLDAINETSKKQNVKKQDIYMELTFWTKDVERPEAPFVAHLTIVDGEIRTFYKEANSDALTTSYDVDSL